MSVATPNAVPQPRAGGQPPNPRPRREAGFGGRVARREGMFPAARHPSPISRDDRRSLPPRVLSRQARQGSAAPTATPRRRARTRRRRQPTPLRQPRRRARVALALDPPPTTSHARTPTLPSPIRRLTIHRSDPIIPRIAIRTSDPRNFTDRTISPSLSHWTTGSRRGDPCGPPVSSPCKPLATGLAGNSGRDVVGLFTFLQGVFLDWARVRRGSPVLLVVARLEAAYGSGTT